MKSVLLNYAKKTSGKDYFDKVTYDREKNMSVYKDGNQCTPLIDAPTINMGVMTKTETAREKDDTLPIVLAVETKTLSHRESDDQSPYHN